MMKIIKKGNCELSYFLNKSKRAKKIRLAVSLEKGIVATIPDRLSFSYLETFLADNFFWLKNKLDGFQSIDQTKLIKTGVNDFLRKKKAAHLLVSEKIEKFNKFYGFEVKRIAIKNQKTRWGSCSSKKNLNFNYKLVYLSDALVDYVVVHELCHLKEMNHSKRFWRLVEELIPNHRECRRRIREESRYIV